MDFYLITNFGFLSATIGVTFFLVCFAIANSAMRHYKYLAVFFVANLASQLDDVYWMFDLWRYAPWLVNLYVPFLFLMAPSIYFYTKSVTNQTETQGKFHSLKLLAGALFAMILCLPYYFLDQEIKIERLNTPSDSLEHLSYVTPMVMIALACFIPFSTYYLFLSFKSMVANSINIRSYFSNISNQDLSWLRGSLIILVLAFLIYTFRWIAPIDAEPNGIVAILFNLFEFAWIGCFGFFAIGQKQIKLSSSKNTGGKQNQYQKSNLSPLEQENIAANLLKAMKHDLLYRDPLLKLSKLAKHIGVNENKISQVFSHEIGQNFYDFVNGWRIKDICAKLDKSDANILQIAFDTGFNSRSTFNAAFKKHTGTTPSKYKKDLNGQK